MAILKPICAILVGLAAAQAAEGMDANRLEEVYNRFIEEFADETPTWKTDITLGADFDARPDPPYRTHYNDVLGYYTYRPKRWSELNGYEKFAVQNDPRLPHFIREHAAQLREQAKSSSAARSEPMRVPDVTAVPNHTDTAAAIQSMEISAKPRTNTDEALGLEARAKGAALPSSPELTELLLRTEQLLQETRALAADVQKRGILTRKGQNEFSYRFDPDELIDDKPIRLLEVP